MLHTLCLHVTDSDTLLIFKCDCDSHYSETIQDWICLLEKVSSCFIELKTEVVCLWWNSKISWQTSWCSLCLGCVCVWKADLMNFKMRDETMRFHKMIVSWASDSHLGLTVHLIAAVGEGANETVEWDEYWKETLVSLCPFWCITFYSRAFLP